MSIQDLLNEWIDEMEKTDCYIPSASFTWDNMIDFAEWYHNKLGRVGNDGMEYVCRV